MTIPQNYTGLDVQVPDTDILFATWTHTWIDGFSYWNEPLASVYEGLGYAFTVQWYHDTMQVPVHHQGFEILRHDHFTFTTRFCELVNHQNPNKVLDNTIVRDYIIDPTNLDPLEGDVIRHFNIFSGEWDFVLIHQTTKPLDGLEEILTQQFWNQMIDAWWRPFGKGRTLGMTHGETYKLMQITMSSTLSTLASPIVLSETDMTLIDSCIKKKSKIEMSHYLLHFAKPLLAYPVSVWPLPVWLGGRYVNTIKPRYAQCVPTKAIYWTYTFLHLAACTTKYLIPPYVSHNKLSISVRMPNGQFGLFSNPHFFTHTDFE